MKKLFSCMFIFLMLTGITFAEEAKTESEKYETLWHQKDDEGLAFWLIQFPAGGPKCLYTNTGSKTFINCDFTCSGTSSESKSESKSELKPDGWKPEW